MEGFALNKIEVNDIFRLYGNRFLEKYGSQTVPGQTKAIRNITNCRTAALGGHVDTCNTCGGIRISYNSCRDRHCPKCQSLPAGKWVLERSEETLPVHYFHLVFTVPNELNPLIYQTRQISYDILFKAASETLIELARDKKHLGAKIGIMGILHTWGQNILYHPHLHFLVTGGGLSPDGTRWISSPKNFLFPVKVMSRLFRGKFLALLEENGLEIDSGIKQKLRKKEWVVYCKPPINDSRNVIRYFGHYTHRVAISNSRIVKLEKDRVYFSWKDYRKNSRVKAMNLDALEFMRRFLLHLLPHDFVKIRYYGLYGNRDRKKIIAHCQSLLGSSIKPVREKIKRTWQQLLLELKGFDVSLCPFCGKGRMQRREILFPLHNASPPGLHIAENLSVKRWAS
jgi:hypothetical protein